MLNPDIRDQAYQFFIEEAPELLEAIEQGLLILRQERSTANVHEIMRAAHSIKGGAASVELEAIKTIAHRLESIFKALYDETIEIDTSLESQLLQAYDCLRLPLVEQIETGAVDTEQALAAAEPILTQLEERLGEALLQVDHYIPSSSDLGIDMVASIFEVDVAQGLERLSMVLQQPDAYPIAGELQAQAEVFLGLSELLTLPGFGKIAEAALTALDCYPDQALTILRLATADFAAGRAAVLGGDRTEGGQPSDQLLALTQSNLTSSDASVLEDIFDYEIDIYEIDILSLEEKSQSKAPETLISFDAAESIENAAYILEYSVTNDLAKSDFLNERFDEAESTLADIFSEAMIDEFGSSKLVGHEVLFESKDKLGANEFADFLSNESNNLLAEPISNELSLTESVADQSLNSQIYPTPESLESAILSAEQLFETLPASEITASLTDQATDSEVSTTAEETTWKQYLRPSNQAVTPTHLSVRVDLHRLERMNNLVGELAINRNSLSLQNDQLQGSVQELVERFEHFQALIRQLQDLSDRMLVAPDRHSTTVHASHTKAEVTALLDSFDSLEMDRYGGLHAQLQEISEQTMQLEEALGDVGLFAGQSNQTLAEQRQKLTQLQNELMWARMLPLGNVLNRFPRVLRDLSAKYSKPVSFKLSGAGVLVDKMVLEKLYDPLLHLLRNAFDHGIELAEVRQKQGKSEQGTIEIRAYHRGNQTLIEISDDGNGLNLTRIGQRAVELGWLKLADLETAKPAQLFDFIFEPGFSTASQVSDLSGRGVGLDVVRAQLRALKGSVAVNSQPGKGATFTLKIPLTLTVAKLLTCMVGSTVMAIPSDSIEEILVPRTEQLKQSGSQQFLHWRQQLVPLYRLSQLLNYTCPIATDAASDALTPVPTPKDWALPLLVIKRSQHSFALEVDRLITEQDLVIKPFGSAITPPAYAYGCTILGDGRLVPVIDAGSLVDLMLEPAAGMPTQPISTYSLPSEPATVPIPLQQAKTILVVDDAAALRRMLALSLEKGGYRVVQARDGQEAIAQLRQTPIELVICDIEMPNMNGFEFLSQRRQDAALAQIPVVMLTSRSNDKHRRLAMHLGATAYFSKPYIEQELLAALKTLVAAPA